MRQPAAQDLMTLQEIVLSETDNLISVPDMMELWNLRQIVIVDGPRFVGILDERDVLRIASNPLDPSPLARGLALRQLEITFVAQLIQTEVPTTRPTAPLEELLQILADTNVQVIPVLGPGERLLGIVRAQDIARAAAHFLEEEDAPPSSDGRYRRAA